MNSRPHQHQSEAYQNEIEEKPGAETSESDDDAHPNAIVVATDVKVMKPAGNSDGVQATDVRVLVGAETTPAVSDKLAERGDGKVAIDGVTEIREEFQPMSEIKTQSAKSTNVSPMREDIKSENKAGDSESHRRSKFDIPLLKAQCGAGEGGFDPEFEALRVKVIEDNHTERLYFEAQERQHKKISQRLETALKSLEHFENYVVNRLHMLQADSQALDITDSKNGWPVYFGQEEAPTLQLACLKVNAVNAKISSHGASLQRLIEHDILLNIRSEVHRITTIRDHINATTTEQMKEVNSQRDKCSKAWSAYQERKRIGKSRVAFPAGNVKDQILLNAQDRESMMAYLHYQRTLSRLQKLQGEYGAFLVDTLRRFSHTDTTRVVRLQRMLVQFAQAQANYFNSCAKEMRDTITVAEGISDSSDHSTYTDDNNIPIVQDDMKNLDALLPPARDKQVAESLDRYEVLKMGVLSYRFVSLGIKTWKPLFALLSGRGVLHLFAKKEDEKPTITLGLQHCSIELAPSVHPNGFRIRESKLAIIGNDQVQKKHAFKTGKQATMAEWMVVMKRFIPGHQVAITPREMKKYHRQRVNEARRQGKRVVRRRNKDSSKSWS
ncbi:hypothetical protein AAMO2058_000162500 [Amorphochlora amoebiformis]